MLLYYTEMNSPIGNLYLIASDAGLFAIEINEAWETIATRLAHKSHQLISRENDFLKQAKGELSEYFAGDRTTFSTPLDLKGTPFQVKVWNLLFRIPYGKTTSYGAIAQQIASPKASRAVGMANGRNPVPIIVPCHRVIGANGSLTGYAGGLAIKEWLLNHEKKSSLVSA